MTKVNDGGPAFPSESYDNGAGLATAKSGMSLRDWFAGQALAGIMANESGADYVFAAREAFEYADAMLVTRSRLKDKPESEK